jgi:hypothetical protein
MGKARWTVNGKMIPLKIQKTMEAQEIEDAKEKKAFGEQKEREKFHHQEDLWVPVRKQDLADWICSIRDRAPEAQLWELIKLEKFEKEKNFFVIRPMLNIGRFQNVSMKKFYSYTTKIDPFSKREREKEDW